MNASSLEIKKNLEEFPSTINKLHEAIQFNMEYNREEIPFVNILVIRTDTIYKAADTHQCQNQSAHTLHINRNILFNMARRICTTVIQVT